MKKQTTDNKYSKMKGLGLGLGFDSGLRLVLQLGLAFEVMDMVTIKTTIEIRDWVRSGVRVRIGFILNSINNYNEIASNG